MWGKLGGMKGGETSVAIYYMKEEQILRRRKRNVSSCCVSEIVR